MSKSVAMTVPDNDILSNTPKGKQSRSYIFIITSMDRTEIACTITSYPHMFLNSLKCWHGHAAKMEESPKRGERPKGFLLSKTVLQFVMSRRGKPIRVICVGDIPAKSSRGHHSFMRKEAVDHYYELLKLGGEEYTQLWHRHLVIY